MAKTTAPNSVVLIDDEWHNVSWIQDYLESNNISVITAENLGDAVAIIEKEIYRALIIDLNIPASGPFNALLMGLGAPYPLFPGLYLANKARNLGYRGRQVMLYTVHREAAVTQEANRLGVTYIIKGRPLEIKRELNSVLSFDPTE